ncbi:MAG: DUF455 family protein [Anaerolineales bacterium]
MPDTYLPGLHPRARWMRLDAAALLKRFFFLEQSLVISQAGWLPAIALLDAKIGLPRHLWEDALTAGALRERVLELRFPNRLMEAGEDAPLLALFEAGRNAPSAEAFVLSLARVFKPALLAGCQSYLAQADEIADGPTLRILRQAVRDQTEQIPELAGWADEMLAAAPAQDGAAEAWVAQLQEQFARLGGVSLGPLPPGLKLGELPGAQPFAVAETPARDARFHRGRFYWPDNFDPTFSYGQGIQLQLRSALSHLNEVWAVETAGAMLYALADWLGWEYVLDAARWCYDESRHCRMGYERLREWGFQPAELPLGSYIYDSGRGQDPLYRLGMLSFFETKNIGRKSERIKAFQLYQDAMSQHDMDYDWADETIHAHYGQHWLNHLVASGYAGAAALDVDNTLDVDAIRARCSELVAATAASATPAERAELRQVAEALLAKAERLAAAPAPEA